MAFSAAGCCHNGVHLVLEVAPVRPLGLVLAATGEEQIDAAMSME
jgi:hypothetical protein